MAYSESLAAGDVGRATAGSAEGAASERPAWVAAGAAPSSGRLVLWSFAVWTTLGLLILLNRYVAGRWAGGRPLTFHEAASNMISMWVWAALSPLIVRWGGRVTVGPGRWGRSLAAHAGLAVGVAWASAGVQWALMGAAGLHRGSPLVLWLGELVIDALCYAGLVALAHAWRYHALYRERQARASELEAEVLRSRLRALEMQLRPHVLFNTLHAVSALARTGRVDDVVRVVAALGELLRALLREESPRVRLGEELGLLERYLRIERIRFGDRLDVRVEVEPGAEGALVPRWLLQPLVENAVRHGLGGGGVGLVEIGVRRRGATLELRVRNGGGARPPAEAGAGVGLANTRERLRCLYGARHDLSLRSLEGGGAELLLALPFEAEAGAVARAAERG